MSLDRMTISCRAVSYSTCRPSRPPAWSPTPHTATRTRSPSGCAWGSRGRTSKWHGSRALSRPNGLTGSVHSLRGPWGANPRRSPPETHDRAPGAPNQTPGRARSAQGGRRPSMPALGARAPEPRGRLRSAWKAMPSQQQNKPGKKKLELQSALTRTLRLFPLLWRRPLGHVVLTALDIKGPWGI